MSARTRNILFIIHCLNLLAFGLPLLIAPVWIWEMYGITLGVGGILVSRIFAGVILGNVLMSWFIRLSDFTAAQRPYALSQIVAWLGNFVVGLTGTMSALFNVMGWSLVLNSTFWIIIYIYMGLAGEPEPTRRISATPAK